MMHGFARNATFWNRWVRKEALQFWREFGPSAPEGFTDGALVFNAPADMPLPDALRREPIVGIGGVYAGPLDEAESVLAPLRRFGPPTADVIQRGPAAAIFRTHAFARSCGSAASFLDTEAVGAKAANPGCLRGSR